MFSPVKITQKDYDNHQKASSTVKKISKNFAEQLNKLYKNQTSLENVRAIHTLKKLGGSH